MIDEQKKAILVQRLAARCRTSSGDIIKKMNLKTFFCRFSVNFGGSKVHSEKICNKMEEKKSKIGIDVVSLLRLIKRDKRWMSVWCGVAAVLALLVAFTTPRIYKSGVMLAPEASDASNLSSSISSIAEMVGMNMNFGGGDDAIYPEIYPDLMKSNDFVVKLFDVHVTSNKGDIKTTYYDYLRHHQKTPWFEKPKEWLHKLVESMQSDKGPKGTPGKVDPFRLTRAEDGIASKIRKNIDCSVDKKTSVISITVTDHDPLIAATMADSVKTLLQQVITDYRTKKARTDLSYMQKLYEEARKRYAKARQQYAAYSDANQDLILESYRAKQEDLENEMQLQYNIYTQVVQQLQLSQANVQKKTPAFTVVQSASVPVKHSNKPKVLVLFSFIFVAFILRVCWLALKHAREIFVTA